MYLKSKIDLYNTDEYVKYSIDQIIANDERIDPDTVTLVYYDDQYSQTANLDLQIGDELIPVNVPYIITITYIRKGQYALMTNYYGYNPKAFECFEEGQQQAFGRIRDVSWLYDIGNKDTRWELVGVQRNIMKFAECGRETYVFDQINKYLGQFPGLDYVLILSQSDTQPYYDHYLDCMDDVITVETDLQNLPPGWAYPSDKIIDYWTRQDLMEMSLTMKLTTRGTYYLVYR